MSQQTPPPASQTVVPEPNSQYPNGPTQGTGQIQRTGQAQGAGQTQGAGRLTGHQFPTRNCLDQRVRSASIDGLNRCLADVTAISMQIKSAHWNVRGPDFYQLHELFEDLAEEFDELIDLIAERATALGGQAFGTAPAVVQQATVPQMPPTLSDEQALVDHLAASLAALDATLYEEINRASEREDLDTADLLNEVSREVSKSLWFLEAHLQSQPTGTGQSATGGQPQQTIQ